MKILLVADGRSPITKNWMQMLSGLGHNLYLVSTFHCEPQAGIELAGILPVGFSALGGGQVYQSGHHRFPLLRGLVARFRPFFLKTRALLAPLTLHRYQGQLNEAVARIQPDLVHALRIPFEGMLTSSLPENVPLVVSIWGNDLTYHARVSRGMAAHTRKTLRRADGLMADAHRDIRLATEWGFREHRPALMAPGNGGLDLAQIQRVIADTAGISFDIPNDRPVVVNPRGFRPGSVHQDVFFRSIPLVLKALPDVFFVCTALLDQPQAERWVRKLDIGRHVLLLPYLEQALLWQLFARADVYVSLSSHDGTPNTFLEALACGCYPVVGDIASLREWLEDGVNGQLVDPTDGGKAADAIVHILRDRNLRESARKLNLEMLQERANREKIRQQVEDFYRQTANMR